MDTNLCSPWARVSSPSERKGIKEHGLGVGESNTVLLLVRCGLPGIPDNSHDSIIYIHYTYIKVSTDIGTSQDHQDRRHLLDPVARSSKFEARTPPSNGKERWYLLDAFKKVRQALSQFEGPDGLVTPAEVLLGAGRKRA